MRVEGHHPRRGYAGSWTGVFGTPLGVCRRQLRERGIRPEIARRKTAHGSGLGRVRWVVARTFAWLHESKRLLVR
jgi:transposase